MRPIPALAALVALTFAPPLGAYGPVPPSGRTGVMPPSDGSYRKDVEIRITPAADAREIVVALRVVYSANAQLPQLDMFPVGAHDAYDVEATADDGHKLEVPPPGPRVMLFGVGRGEPRAIKWANVRFKQAFPDGRRYGWTRVSAALDWTAMFPFNVTHDVRTVIEAPAGTELPSFTCADRGEDAECTRVTPQRLEPTRVVARLPIDVFGSLLLLVTTVGSAFGFDRARRKRRDEIEKELRELPPEPVDLPGGAYREAPRKALSAPIDPTPAWRALDRRAVVLALAGTALAAALAIFADGRSPWPMAWLMAAWIAVVGLGCSLLVERP